MGIYETAYLLSGYGISRVMVFPIGEFKTAKYPKLSLDRPLAEAIVVNFERKVLGATEPFIDSSGRHDEGAPAAGWIKGLYIAPWNKGEALFADIEWTSEGSRLVKEKLYKYLSPVIAPHIIPETGEKVYPVLRSMTLTNIPVLRMMPEVVASEEDELVEIACSEMVLLAEDGEGQKVEEVMEKESETTQEEVTEPTAEVEEPKSEETPPNEEESPSDEETVDDVIAEMLKSLEKLNGRIHRKRGAPAIRAQMKQAITAYKSRIAAGEDSSDLMYSILAEFEKSGKEMNGMMDKLIAKFSLAEDASEDDILAAFEAQLAEVEVIKEGLKVALSETETKVTDLTEKLEAAENEIAEGKKAAHIAEIEHRLSEAISANLVTPAEVGDEENPGWLRKLALTDEALFDEYLDSRKTPAVDTEELGEGSPDEDEPIEEEVRADVKLAKMGREYQEQHPDLSLGEAQNAVRRENPEIDAAYKKLLEEQLIRHV